jgi:hypothetical protein
VADAKGAYKDLIGAVTVLANAFVSIYVSFLPSLILSLSWLPLGPLRHCLSYTGCKLIIVDLERASVLEPIASQLIEEVGVAAFLVLDGCHRSWRNMKSLDKVVDAYSGYHDPIDLFGEKIDPEDNATIVFTSGIYPESIGILASS